MSRRLLGAACVIVGAAGVAACLLAASAGMRDVMVNDGGSCASGGPYVVAHQCSGADMRLMLVGILGGLVATAILVAGSAALGRDGSGLLAWVALFGLFGWNFVRMVIHPPAGQQGSSGWLISGVVFWLLAAGGLVPLLGGLLSDLRTAGRPDPIAASMQPLVRAQFIPSGWTGGFGSSGAGTAAGGVTPASGSGSFGWGSPATPVPGLGSGQAPATVARNPSAAWLALWVGLIVLGGALGAVASSALISALK